MKLIRQWLRAGVMFEYRDDAEAFRRAKGD